MRILDFFKREPIVTTPPRSAQARDPARRVTPEELIEDRWTFAPVDTANNSRVFDDRTIYFCAAIYAARQVRRIADDVEAIRKHLTRLRVAPQRSRADDATDDGDVSA